VLEDDARAGALGAQARATVESELSWDRYVDRLVPIIDIAARS
jgi:hypothetical protein